MFLLAILYFNKHFSVFSIEIIRPDALSSDLQDAIEEFSGNTIDVNVVDVINHNRPRTSASGWAEQFSTILVENNLCERIEQEDIDQIWTWVDPRTGHDTAPGMEYAISSERFQV